MYDNITITADFIEIDFKNNEIFAKGLPDSTGYISGWPVFKEGSDQFEASTIRYNFDNKKGLIQNVVTEQDGGFLHSKITKKHANSVIDLKKGKYTTCDHEHPHFYIAMTKARIIQNEKIVSGPLYLVMADIPTPIAIPFGFFPFTKNRASGIIIPRYGESREKGIFLAEGGYYWAGTDYFDFKATGSIYTKGSWDAALSSRYKLRYKFSGDVTYNHEKILMGEKGGSDEVNTFGYTFKWQHKQDPKANPFQRFNANVNIQNSTTQKYSVNTDIYIKNLTTSDVSYTRYLGTLFTLTSNLKHTLNTVDTTVTVELPTLNLTMKRITPFTPKQRVGKSKWYENISVNYGTNFINRGKMHEDVFLKSEMFDSLRYGFNHSVRADAPIKVFKYITFSPNVSYTERWFFEYMQKSIDTVNLNAKDVITRYEDFNRVWDYSTSASLQTTLYGMFSFHPSFPVEAIRIVHRPSVSLSYRPDFSDKNYGYYVYSDTVIIRDTVKTIRPYDKFSGNVFSSVPGGKSGMINFSLNNNIETKIRTAKDSTNQSKKIAVFDDLGFTTSYNHAADSLKWSPLNITARTRILNILDVGFNSQLDWYALDTIYGKKINQFRYKVDGKTGRITYADLSVGFSLSPQTFSKNTKQKPVLEPSDCNYYYNYFEIPWSVRVAYKYTYRKPENKKFADQTIRLDGDMSITKKWKVTYSTGYDLENKKLSLTEFGIVRDLHCWVMKFKWVPFGDKQMYMFEIGVKSTILQDLKYDKREDFWDIIR
jgi:hypothetical protein